MSCGQANLEGKFFCHLLLVAPLYTIQIAGLHALIISPIRYIDIEYRLYVAISPLLKNIDIDMVIFENIAIDIDIDKEILKISISIRQL